MINFLKGIAVGIFNIIPGLSGSALLVVLDLYEDCLYSIGNIFKKPKDNFLFLFPISLGIILGTYLFSNIIFVFLDKFNMELSIIFTFFILGTIPHLFTEAIKYGFRKCYLFPFTISFLLGCFLLFFDSGSLNYFIDYSVFGIIKYFFIGSLLSFSTVIPGISSTVLLSLTGLYGVYIFSLSSLNFFVLIPILFGFCATTFVIAKIISYLFKNYYGFCYFAIVGFSLSTIPTLLKVQFIIDSGFFISIFVGFFSFLLTSYSFRVMR